MKDDEISVVVPVFGRFRRWQLLSIVLSSWRNQTIKPTVWLAYSGTANREQLLQRGCGAANHIVHVSRSSNGCSPGRIRNAALVRIKSSYVYVTDADVLPREESFLAQCLESARRSKAVALIKPALLRVYAPEAAFCAWYAGGDRRRPLSKGPCLRVLRAGKLEPMTAGEFSRRVDGERLCCRWDDLQLLKAYAGRENELKEFIMKPKVHWGGIFAQMNAIRRVGGYSETYRAWGCEDDDLHFKLGSTCGHQRLKLPGNPWPLFHLEHPRQNNTESYRRNFRRFMLRRKTGVDRLLDSDCLAFGTLANGS